MESEIKWCGRIIDKNGIRHDPARIQALNDLGYPETAGDLMQFICASGWMRASIIDYARLAEPLSRKLHEATAGMKKTKRVPNGVKIDMSDGDRNAFDVLKAAIVNAASLAFPTSGARMCMFTDASDLGWAIIITQVLDWNPDKMAMNKTTRCCIVPVEFLMGLKPIGQLWKRNAIQWPRPVQLWTIY